MSSSIFPYILFLIGLNFINSLVAAPSTGPVYRFADKLESVPAKEFYDLVEFAGATWFAADGLYRLTGDSWEQVLADERISALAVDPENSRLWFAGSGRIGSIDQEGAIIGSHATDAGFVWSLAWHENFIWYFTSTGYGWINPETFEVGQYREQTFEPRPLLANPQDRTGGLFIGSDSGLWRITKEGCRLELSLDQTGSAMVAWVEVDREDYLLGTRSCAYRWSGNPGEDPVAVESNYNQFFRKGINNSVGLEDYIAIAEYPDGVAIWNRELERISESVVSGEGFDLGQVFKVSQVGSAQVAVLGMEGAGLIDFKERSRFFPYWELWNNDDLRHFIASDDSAYLFTDGNWIRLFDDGYEKGELLRTANWVDLNPEGIPVLGAINIYEEFSGEDWVDRELPSPLFEFMWGETSGYALGVEGIYAVNADFDLKLIHEDDRPLELVGEYAASLYVLEGGRKLLQLSEDGDHWSAEGLPYKFDGPIITHGIGSTGIWLATETTVYNFTNDLLETLPLAPGWIARSMSVSGDEAFVLFENPVSRSVGVGVYEEAGQVMFSVPYIERVGEVLGVVSNKTRVGLIGSQGVGWYAIEELIRLAAPRVDFALLLEDRQIEDRTIPSGMHFIDLQITFSEPTIPSIVQFRINEKRWRTVNLQDPSLQFAGHGNFTVELRAMHPNGKVSSSKMVRFGIAPPWYLNPIYQGLMLVASLLFFWGLFALRSAQLKRTNFWLQSEVKKQTRELEAATAARTNFLAGLSHDIRNPLNGVLMITETLARNPPKSGDDPRLKDLTEFGVIVDRMLGEILDFSAIDQQNIPTAFIPVSVNDIIESTVKQNQFGILHEMITLNTFISPELEDVIIRTDRNWMIKIMSNLLINSLQYSETDRVEVGAKCINISEHEVDLELFVADWGIGIDESEREFVFERFYRGESGVESGKHGTGLGLSICQEIAHAMGGHLRLESNDPSGCRFVLKGRFDRVEGATELDKEAVLAQLKGKRILVVDDLVYNRQSVVEFFQTIGCECDQAEDGRMAMDLLSENDYYLALLDWDLPGLTGPEISRRHRKKSPEDEVILVAVTAYTDGEKKRESEEAGMNGYISKPLTSARLAHCLANIQNWKPELDESSDMVATDEVTKEIYNHIEECLLYGERYEWENLRRSAHRLTTLALIRNNRPMQLVCRDLQVSAQSENIEDIHVGLLELQKWRKS